MLHWFFAYFKQIARCLRPRFLRHVVAPPWMSFHTCASWVVGLNQHHANIAMHGLLRDSSSHDLPTRRRRLRILQHVRRELVCTRCLLSSTQCELLTCVKLLGFSIASFTSPWSQPADLDCDTKFPSLPSLNACVDRMSHWCQTQWLLRLDSET